MSDFILADENLNRTYLGTFVTRKKFDGLDLDNWAKKNLGHVLLGSPFEAHTRLNPTGPPGFLAGIWFSLFFQMRKWEYFVQRAQESIEVNPVHQQYYQITMKQKQELEHEIKSGLASAAQSVADLELLKHDERKYREFLDYFGWQFDERNNSFKDSGKRDDHALRSVFIDLVDVHTGEGIAIRTIVSRWPTLIVDFMKLADGDMDTDKVKEKLDVSKAEAVVLVTKNKLYVEWKKLFGAEVQNRYRRIVELVRSREHSVHEYRDWLRPVVARHQLLQEGLEGKGIETFKSLYLTPIGQATSYTEVSTWAWRETGQTTGEFFKGNTELLGQQRAEGQIDPYDEWTKRNLIFHPKHGLVTEYPWITHEWAKQQRDWMVSTESQGSGAIRPWIDLNKVYYVFFIIRLEKVNIRMPTGAEAEDGVFDINFFMFSENVLFAKLLELKAHHAKLNHYIDDLIGVRDPKCPICKPEGSRPEQKKGRLEPVKKALDFMNMQFMFSKKGPYERDFDERVVKLYLRPAVYGRFLPVVKFIKQKAGYGEA